MASRFGGDSPTWLAAPMLLTLSLALGCGNGSTASVTTGAGGQTTATGAGGVATTGAGGATSATTGAGGVATGTGGSLATGVGGDTATGLGGGAGASDAGGSAGSGAGGSGVTGAAGSTVVTGSGGTPATGAGGATGASGGTAGTGSPAWGTPVAGGPTGTGVTANVTVDSSTQVGTIGPGFAGFSYEKTHISNGSLTASNASLVALYKLLGTPVIRLGADEVDSCTWKGTGTAPAKPSGQPFSRSITTGMVDQICGFLAATNAKIIYGVNFKSNNPTASAAEAAYAEGKCGSSILGFEIGNEINRFESPLYDWNSIKAEYEGLATAVLATPGVLLVGPAGGGGDALSLSTPFAADESAKFGSKLVLLTQHYYSGTAGTNTATVARLQTPDPNPSPTSQTGLLGTLTTMNTAATTNKIAQGYRCGECNTFAGHGQMGVSDTLIAGLWGLDLMFVTAKNGGSGVNLHGGETGMDGSKPFYYEPIMENGGVVVQVQPIYYSMLVMNLAGTGPMVSTTVTTSNPNFTAYAIKASGFTSVVLDNKSATSAVNATVNLGTAVGSASAIYLQGTPAGSLTAEATTVTLAGAGVTPTGTWNPGAPFVQTTSGNTVSVYVPAASAALVRVQ